MNMAKKKPHSKAILVFKCRRSLLSQQFFVFHLDGASHKWPHVLDSMCISSLLNLKDKIKCNLQQ